MLKIERVRAQCVRVVDFRFEEILTVSVQKESVIHVKSKRKLGGSSTKDTKF